jgi:predicted CoA-binding protein
MSYSDAFLKDILTRTRRIAVVGVSMNPVRPSYYVARYLGLKGFDVVPVNPLHAGETVFGKTVVPSLSDIEGPVDMVDIFRRSEAVPEIVEEALEAFPEVRTIWMQIGVCHSEAAARAEARGVDVVQDRCPKIEYQRLFGELRMGGFATGIISSKLR